MKREEAIEVIKELQPNDRLREALRTLIPELSESKDERIRKWLIEMVEEFRKLNPTNAEHNGNCSEAIAYLERQKEQIVIKQNIIDSIRANTQPDWDFSTIPNLHKEINRFFGEKFILPHTENTIITISDVIRCAYHFYKFGQQEQKSSECLKAERDGWYVCIKDYYRGGSKRSSVGDLVQAKGGMHIMGEEDISEWFRKAYYEEVRDTFEHNEKPEEWRDKDKKIINEISNIIVANAKDGYLGGYFAPDLVMKLQSLHPQPLWKPSEEQMKFLKRIVNGYDITCRGQVELESLYKCLKKLM